METANIREIRDVPSPTRVRVSASTLSLCSCRSIEWSSWLACLIPRPARPWWSSTPRMRSRRSLSPRGLIVARRENRSIPEYGLLTVSPKHAPLARCEPSRHRRLRWRRAGSRYATRASATDVVAHRRSALGARAVLRRVRSGAAPMGPEPHPDTRPDRSGHRWADGLARCASPRCAGCSPTHGGYAQTLPSLTRYTWRSPRTLAPTSFLMMADWPTPLARQFGSCTCRTDS